MDFMGEASFAGGNMIPDSTSNGSGFDNWGPGFSDQAVWATEDDYRDWNTGPSSETPSSSNRSGSEPPHKKSRSSQGADSHVTSRSKAIGKMFFKTKLCCKFRAGVCPYINNCNFAHGIEELRKPPPNWQEIVAEHESEHGGGGGVMLEFREEHQIPTVSSPELRIETQRSFKGRHCKKFYTEEGCPYGDTCTFLHDEQSRARESVAISVTPTVGGFGNNAAGANLKPSNWKTRICNKWETTGYCPFGSKCHFAHGAAELHKYGGGLMETEGKDPLSTPPDLRQGGGSLKTTESTVPSTISAPHTDVYHLGPGIQVQRSSGIVQRAGHRVIQKWKGPDKISKIYGDWIDDIE
ncbi:PREDICTED: zinc finger CCCH domain-containing protein 56-like [Nicotiana attenuata]|uniref:Zinc finger ccch domain-containing protein 56 n=1 Tax=Nicotiana attenuata TaxID=49451 RepID=A0A314L6U1_NICAT|nr:PREDICTED: zinc finger CCCH domain-containing protein 56-like [Nicotiana attenuata]OIT37292.1 zinc finger ccch domain-containing protein 56 [Nicotiana attenuata]